MGLALVFLHLTGSSAYPTTIFNISNSCVAIPLHVWAPVCFFHYTQHGPICLPSHMLKPFQTSLSHSPLLLPNYLLASSSTDITFYILQSILSTLPSLPLSHVWTLAILSCLTLLCIFQVTPPLATSSEDITFHTLQSILTTPSILFSHVQTFAIFSGSLFSVSLSNNLSYSHSHRTYNTEWTVKSNILISYHMTAFKKWCQRNGIPCNITCLTLLLPPCAVCWGGMQEDQRSSGCLPDRGRPGGPHMAGAGLKRLLQWCWYLRAICVCNCFLL